MNDPISRPFFSKNRLAAHSLLEILVSMALLGALCLLAFGSIDQAMGPQSTPLRWQRDQFMQEVLLSFDGSITEQEFERQGFQYALLAQRISEEMSVFEVRVKCFYEKKLLSEKCRIIRLTDSEIHEISGFYPD